LHVINDYDTTPQILSATVVLLVKYQCHFLTLNTDRPILQKMVRSVAIANASELYLGYTPEIAVKEC